jgi:hypothetical protein
METLRGFSPAGTSDLHLALPAPQALRACLAMTSRALAPAGIARLRQRDRFTPLRPPREANEMTKHRLPPNKKKGPEGAPSYYCIEDTVLDELRVFLYVRGD